MSGLDNCKINMKQRSKSVSLFSSNNTNFAIQDVVKKYDVEASSPKIYDYDINYDKVSEEPVVRTYDDAFNNTTTYTTTNSSPIDPIALTTTAPSETTNIDRYANTETTTVETTTQTVSEVEPKEYKPTYFEAFAQSMENVKNAKEPDDATNGVTKIEHEDTRLKVFYDNRIKYHSTGGNVQHMAMVDTLIAKVMPYGSAQENLLAKKAYNETARNLKGNFFVQHSAADVQKYDTFKGTIKSVADSAAVEKYASNYSYNNSRYESDKQFFKELSYDPNKVTQFKNSFKNNYTFMNQYMKSTGGMAGMRQEVKQNMGGSSFWGLVKEGRNANSIRGDSKYIVGYNTKLANFTIYKKGLWSAKEIEHNALRATITDKEYAQQLNNVEEELAKLAESGDRNTFLNGQAATYAGYVDIGEGTVEFDAFKARARYQAVNAIGDIAARNTGYAEFNAGQAKAKALLELSGDHFNAVASASVCVVEAEVGEDIALEKRVGNANLHLCGSSIRGDARALEADANALITGGFYTDEEGKAHIDAGVSLAANAELCSAGVSQSVDIFGVGTTATARVKIGAGALCNVGFQDGEFKFKIGLAVGVGFDVGGSVDISGLLNNIGELNKEYHFLDPLLDVWDAVPHNPIDFGAFIGKVAINNSIHLMLEVKKDYENAKAFIAKTEATISLYQTLVVSYTTNKINEVKDNVVETVTEAREFVTDKIDEAKDIASTTFNVMSDYAFDKAREIKDSTIEKIHDVEILTETAFDVMSDYAFDKAREIKDSAAETIDEALYKAEEFFDDLPDVDDIADSAKSFVGDKVSSICSLFG